MDISLRFRERAYIWQLVTFVRPQRHVCAMHTYRYAYTYVSLSFLGNSWPLCIRNIATCEFQWPAYSNPPSCPVHPKQSCLSGFWTMCHDGFKKSVVVPHDGNSLWCARCVYLCIHIHVYICIFVCMYTHIYMKIFIYTRKCIDGYQEVFMTRYLDTSLLLATCSNKGYVT